MDKVSKQHNTVVTKSTAPTHRETITTTTGDVVNATQSPCTSMVSQQLAAKLANEKNRKDFILYSMHVHNFIHT